MSADSPVEKMSSTKQALLEIRRLRAELDSKESRLHAPIAIIGCGLRFPGDLNTPQEFWDFLIAGKDAIDEIPPSRWNVDNFYDPDRERVGKMYTRSGGHLSSVDKFDAQFFGISPREAASMDPQQRLLLEVSWEALENAGQSADRLRGSRTGVFIGMCNSDYSRLVFNGSSTPDVSAATGNESSVAAGRISYILGLQGPSLVVDTACSSSLVALHLAAQSLRRGECDLAIVGGVNLILSPEMHINFCQAQMLSADGRCKTFDALADGYGRGEGCAAIVLKRYDSALADNNRVVAIVRGTAMNQDGQSAGLTAPNGLAQESVLKDAIADAGIAAGDIGYVEAHGTGTPLGDPIEARALGSAIGKHRDSNSPLLIGSAKTNFGHLEAAAGLAGVIKTALSLYHRRIPKHLNYYSTNSEIPLNELNLKVVNESMDWPANYQRFAGVSSFGFSGTNAHVVLEGATSDDFGFAGAAELPGLEVLTISAQNEAAMNASIRNYHRFLSDSDEALTAVARTSTEGRSHMAHRLAVVCSSTADAAEQLEGVLSGTPSIDVKRGHVRAGAEPPRMVILFSGQGGQYPGMGRGLYSRFPAYRAALTRVTQLFDSTLDADPLLDVIHSADNDGRVNEALYTQPATFSVTYALYELWRSWGVNAEIVMGHSLGEYMAAVASGILDVGDAVTLIAERARLMSGLDGGGSMAVVFADFESVKMAISESNVELDIAAINAPGNTVISGLSADIKQVLGVLANQGSDARELKVSNAFHSRLLDPILDEFEAVANGIKYGEPQLAMLSNVSGDYLKPDERVNGKYWRDHFRKPVQFRKSIERLECDSNTIILELGPHPVLIPMLEGQVDGKAAVVSALRRDSDDVKNVFSALATIHVHGGIIDWQAFHRSNLGTSLPQPIEIPTYPFLGERHWVDSVPASSVDSNGALTWNYVAAAATTAAGSGPLNLDVDQLEATWSSLRELSKCYVVNAFCELDLFVEQGSIETLDSIMRKSSIEPTYSHLIKRWLRLLAEEDLLILDAKSTSYCSPNGLSTMDIAGPISVARRYLASESFVVDYIQRCGEMLPGVITGKIPGLETLFPGGSTETADKLYTEYSVSKYISSIAAASVAAVAASQRHIVQILEIGAGTGGTTAAVLPALVPGRVKYCFTDISDYFLGQAEQRFSSFDFMDYRVLDVGGDTGAQGFPDHSLDVIIATNVLHATPDLRQTLRNVLRLLKSNGVLVLSEVTRELTWFDITTGLIEGWQSFDDDLRSDSPLLATNVWESALADAGFEQVLSLPDKDSYAVAVGQNVLLARAPTRGDADYSGSALSEHRSDAVQIDNTPLQDEILENLRGAPDSERHELLLDHVIGLVCMILRLPESDTPDGIAGLFDLGLDSLMSLDFRRRLALSLKLEDKLPATLVFDYPNAESIAVYLEDTWLRGVDEASGTTVDDVPMPNASSSAISNEEIEDLSDEEVEAMLIARLDADTGS